jgi:hypothetical protein
MIFLGEDCQSIELKILPGRRSRTDAGPSGSRYCAFGHTMAA